MKFILIFYLCSIVLSSYSAELKLSGNKVLNLPKAEKIELGIDSLPDVFTKNHADLIESRLRLEAQEKFTKNTSCQLILDEWKVYREELKTGNNEESRSGS